MQGNNNYTTHKWGVQPNIHMTTLVDKTFPRPIKTLLDKYANYSTNNLLSFPILVKAFNVLMFPKGILDHPNTFFPSCPTIINDYIRYNFLQFLGGHFSLLKPKSFFFNQIARRVTPSNRNHKLSMHYNCMNILATKM